MINELDRNYQGTNIYLASPTQHLVVSNEASGKIWAIRADSECEHPPEKIEHVGDDGKNSYFQCQECDSMLITEIGNVTQADKLNNAYPK